MNHNKLEQQYRRYIDRFLEFNKATYPYGWSELVNEVVGNIDVLVDKTDKPKYLLLDKLSYYTLTLHLWETNQVPRDVLPSVIQQRSNILLLLYDTQGVLTTNNRVAVFQDLADTPIWNIT